MFYLPSDSRSRPEEGKLTLALKIKKNEIRMWRWNYFIGLGKD